MSNDIEPSLAPSWRGVAAVAAVATGFAARVASYSGPSLACLAAVPLRPRPRRSSVWCSGTWNTNASCCRTVTQSR